VNLGGRQKPVFSAVKTSRGAPSRCRSPLGVAVLI
jgi:hypothetical protein